MRTRPILLNNRFKASQESGFNPEAESIVFISYKRNPDLPIAYECAKRLDSVGINYWIDEEDECLSNARSWTSGTKRAIETAKCIEKGLDVASALLGIIGPETFRSPWIPYEIGGAQGRQRFRNFYTGNSQPIPHPLIAHFIHDDVDIRKVPDFVALGTPLLSPADVSLWAKSVAEILKEIREATTRKITFMDAREIRKSYTLDHIYNINIRSLGTLSDIS